jgi:arylsulfatase A-like enzyme
MALPALASVAGAGPALDRSELPIAEPKQPVSREIDARKVKMPPLFQVKAPAGAPNVVIVLIDDLGFGAPSVFGGPVQTPTLDGLAQNGLRYNNFHTTALCSPTRAALKSGRNHHTLNMGFIIEMATGFPGNTGKIPNATALLAEMLRLNGYSTAVFGKWHETAAWEASVAGPFDRWSMRQGFDKFFGFLSGETNQWAPLLYGGTAVVEFTDHEIGRMLQAFADVGQADNTLVFYIAGDNGTSGEGGVNGMFSEMTYFNGVQENVEDMLKLIDQWGGPETYPHMAAGWAVALDAPDTTIKIDAIGAAGARHSVSPGRTDHAR